MEMSNPMSEWKFKRDTTFRKQFFVPDSFAHPAKMDAQLLIRIVETYTEPGETILDPMAGSGTTMLACMLGRNVILVELEEKFVKICRDNWEQVKMRPQLGYTMGQCVIIQGDARQIENILCDKIITSPPYGNPRNTTEEYDDKYDLRRPKGVAWGRESFRGRYGTTPGQIGELPYGQLKGLLVDKIVTSPPYAESDLNVKPVTDKYPELKGKGGGLLTGLYKGHGDNPNNIGNLPYGAIDKIVTSPPYAETDVSQSHMTSKRNVIPGHRNYRPSHKRKFQDGTYDPKEGRGYSERPDNIGNLPYGEIDKIITSPPYENAQATKDDDYVSRHTTGGQLATYHTSASNIGNLKSIYKLCSKYISSAGKY
jgi:DNA modification methylase